MAKNKGKSKKGEMSMEEFEKELIRLAKQLHDHCNSNGYLMMTVVAEATLNDEVRVHQFVSIAEDYAGTNALCATAGELIEQIGMSRQQQTGELIRHIVLDTADARAMMLSQMSGLAANVGEVFPARPSGDGEKFGA